MFELIVRAFIQDDNKRMLLVKRAKEPEKGKWSLVGGKVEFGEKAIDTVVRELKEELQIRFFPKFVFYTESPDHIRKVHSLLLYYDGKFTGEIKTKADEIIDHKFFTREEIKKSKDFAWNHREIVLKYLKSSNQ